MTADDPLPPSERSRLARSLWGKQALDARGRFAVASPEQEIELLRARVRELQGLPPFSRLQQIQLELIHDHSFNFFDGRRVHADLLAHRSLWISALLDRLGSLIKLRDLPLDVYNVDTLFVLARDATSARTLRSLRRAWRADEAHIASVDETCRLLGGGQGKHRLVSFWWD